MSSSGQGPDRDDGRIPADKMGKHTASFGNQDYDHDVAKDKTKNSREQSYSNIQVPGGPNSRAQVQPGMHNESQVIPALKNKGNKGYDLPEDDPLGGGDGDNGGVGLENAEEIRLADSSKAQPLIPYLSEQIVKGIFSKNWNIRDQAVKVISREIIKGGKSEM